MSKEIEKLVPVGQPCLVVPLNLWLQWNGDGDPEDSGDVAESEVTWSREKIFDADVEYVHADEIRRALMGHRRSELWGDNGLIAATMRCVDAVDKLEALYAQMDPNGTIWDYAKKVQSEILTVTKERDEAREQRDMLAEALREMWPFIEEDDLGSMNTPAFGAAIHKYKQALAELAKDIS